MILQILFIQCRKWTKIFVNLFKSTPIPNVYMFGLSLSELCNQYPEKNCNSYSVWLIFWFTTQLLENSMGIFSTRTQQLAYFCASLNKAGCLSFWWKYSAMRFQKVLDSDAGFWQGQETEPGHNTSKLHISHSTL